MGKIHAEGMIELEIGPRTADRVFVSLERVFPADLIEDFAVDLGRGVDEYVPPKVAEAAVVSFVKALQLAGWVILRPGDGTHNSANEDSVPSPGSTLPDL